MIVGDWKAILATLWVALCLVFIVYMIEAASYDVALGFIVGVAVVSVFFLIQPNKCRVTQEEAPEILEEGDDSLLTRVFTPGFVEVRQ
ncbi:hypothetical protein HOA92_07615 [archaeon]|jgi:hypothetical protein|nr:hypothetical protein [archaeon]MBT6762880.1 hypothetical protein [archaeon]MBT7706912.1 hypothetical protein [archaeon]